MQLALVRFYGHFKFGKCKIEIVNMETSGIVIFSQQCIARIHNDPLCNR